MEPFPRECLKQLETIVQFGNKSLIWLLTGFLQQNSERTQEQLLNIYIDIWALMLQNKAERTKNTTKPYNNIWLKIFQGVSKIPQEAEIYCFRMNCTPSHAFLF